MIDDGINRIWLENYDPEVKGHLDYEAIPLYEILERTAADQQQFSVERDQLKAEMLQNERIELFAAWLEGLKDRAKIDDFRDLYF